MNETVENLRGRLQKALSEDVSHNDSLGLQNGFHEVQDTKNKVATRLLHVLDELVSVQVAIPTKILEKHLEVLKKLTSKIDELLQQVAQAIRYKAPDGNFFNQRQRAHNTAAQLASSFESELCDVENSLITARTVKTVRELDLDASMGRIRELEQELKNAEEKYQSLIKALQGTAAKKSYDQSQSSYIALAETHSTREWWWFSLLVVSLMALGGAVSYIIWGNYSATDLTDAIMLVLRKAFMISAPLLLLKISLTKYNAERHLHILYDHRNAAIEQLRLLEASIDNTNDKAQLRLEAAKMILSDPASSYGSNTDSSEININPVFTALEKVTGRGDG